MKYVYALVSSDQDDYYQQFLLSITSLRYYNPHIPVILLTDVNTRKNLVNKRSEYEKLVTDIITINIPIALSQKEISRWIKTSIMSYISDDFLFLDCDTVITSCLDFVFSPDIKIGAVLDTHVPLSKHRLKNDFIEWDKKAGFCSSENCTNYYNSGIIFCRNLPETHDFFNKWHHFWQNGNKKGISADQPSFNHVNYENNIITEMPGEWNCQITHNGLPYLHNAKIIHYYATSLASFNSPYLLSSEQVFAKIKEKGTITQDLQKILKNPKSAFEYNSKIISDKIVFDILESAFFSKLLWLRRKHEKLFFKINSMLKGK